MSELIVIAVSIFAAAMGVLGLSSPAAMARYVSGWQSKVGLWAAAAVRLVFGVALWQAAAASRSPAVFKVLGAISVVSAFSLPLMGVSRFQALLAWWSRQSASFVRIWSAAAVIISVYFIWSVTG
jgi:hypothetical protein